MLDLVLAVVHHLLVFSLAGILAAELVLVGPGMGPLHLRRVARLDLFYGLLAGLILLVGFVRAIYAAKGWNYYQTNLFFWAKIGTFLLVGLLSIWPTMRMTAWRRAEVREHSALPLTSDVAAVRRVLWLEAIVFAFIPIFAALMARGYGSF